MEIQRDNLDTSDKASALSARLKIFESTLLSKYIVDERFSHAEDYNQFYNDILGTLREENELIKNCGKVKMLLTQPTDTNVDESVITPSEGTSDEIVSVLSPPFTESIDNINPTMPSEDAQKDANKEDNGITVEALQPNEQITSGHYLSHFQDFRDNEDILSLSPSDSESEHSEDDQSNYITSAENIYNQEKTSSDETFAENENTHKENDNHRSDGDCKTIDDDFARVCFNYLTKRCNNRECKYKHTHPDRDHLKKMLKKLNEHRLMELVHNKRLHKKYADCFSETLSKRRFTGRLISLTVAVLTNEAEMPEGITNSVVNTTLLYLNYNSIELRRYKDCFYERSLRIKLIYSLLKRLLDYTSLYTLKQAFVSLTDFASKYVSIKVSLTEKFIEKICNEPYDKCIAQGLKNMIFCTGKEIFNGTAIKTFENFISPDESVYKRYLLLKEKQITKYVPKHSNAAAPQNISSLNSDHQLYENETEKYGSSPISDESDPRDLPGPSTRYENNINSDRTIPNNRQLTEERHLLGDINKIDATSHQILHYPNAQKKYYNRDRVVCLYNLRNNCNKPNCQFAHKYPNNEEMTTLLMQIDEQKILQLLGDKRLVAEYGKCFANASYDRCLTKPLMIVAVEILKTNTSIEDEVKTEILNITLRYINNFEVDAIDCKESLNCKIKDKQVRVLLLEEILRSESFNSLKMAFRFLINFITNDNGAFSTFLAEDILRKVCSSYDHKLASDFMKILRFTHPKLLRHGLMADFKELLKSDKELYDNFNEVIKTIDCAPRIHEEIRDIPSVPEINIPIRNVQQPAPKLNKETPRTASTKVLQPINRLADTSFVDTSIIKKKKQKVKIQQCNWAPAITSKGNSANCKKSQENCKTNEQI